MYKSGGRHKMRLSAVKAPLAVKGLALIFVLCVGVRLLSSVGAAGGSEQVMAALFSSDRFLSGVMDFELGGPAESGGAGSLAALIFRAAVRPASGAAASTDSAADASASTGAANADESTETGGAESAGLYYELGGDAAAEPSSNADGGAEAAAGPTDFVTPNIVTETAEPAGVCIDNRSDYNIDVAALLKEPLNITLSGDSPAILIIHTHTSEAYMPDGDDQYEASDSFRTQDKLYSVVRVGDELASEFAKRGIAFIHDRNVYDYPSYQGSYSRSYESIQSYLDAYPSIKIVIDLHRDAIQADDGTVYKTLAQVGENKCAQVMLVMGTDSAGLNHPSWRENLKLALHLEDEMNQLYPSLAKPIWLSEYRYNQQATTGSMLVEIGCTGNTLEEALAAARYFADAASNVFLGLYG